VGASSGTSDASAGPGDASRGPGGASRGADGASSGAGGASRGAGGASRGADGASRGAGGASSGADGASRGAGGASRGASDASRGAGGASRGAGGALGEAHATPPAGLATPCDDWCSFSRCLNLIRAATVRERLLSSVGCVLTHHLNVDPGLVRQAAPYVRHGGRTLHFEPYGRHGGRPLHTRRARLDAPFECGPGVGAASRTRRYSIETDTSAVPFFIGRPSSLLDPRRHSALQCGSRSGQSRSER
jgi:hypothetical protein